MRTLGIKRKANWMSNIRRLRTKVKPPSEETRRKIQQIFGNLSIEERVLAFSNWGKLGRVSWLMEPDIDSAEVKAFALSIKKLEQQTDCKQIFGVMISARMMIMLPGETEEQILLKLQKRTMLC